MLRVLGWRYSATREAWVHRIGKGRRGPVFVERRRHAPNERAVDDDRLYRAMAEQTEQTPPSDPPPRDEPADAVEREEPPEPEERPAPPRRIPANPPALARRKVRVRLDPDAPPKEVVVDGRPPRLGTVIAIGRARETA